LPIIANRDTYVPLHARRWRGGSTESGADRGGAVMLLELHDMTGRWFRRTERHI